MKCLSWQPADAPHFDVAVDNFQVTTAERFYNRKGRLSRFSAAQCCSFLSNQLFHSFDIGSSRSFWESVTTLFWNLSRRLQQGPKLPSHSLLLCLDRLLPVVTCLYPPCVLFFFSLSLFFSVQSLQSLNQVVGGLRDAEFRSEIVWCFLKFVVFGHKRTASDTKCHQWLTPRFIRLYCCWRWPVRSRRGKQVD